MLNSIALMHHWDPEPFILLNLGFSTQAAYAAPLILLAETRQAERDKFSGETIEKRHDEMERRAAERVAALKAETDKLEQLLTSNTDLTRQDKELTEQVAALTREIHAVLTKPIDRTQLAEVIAGLTGIDPIMDAVGGNRQLLARVSDAFSKKTPQLIDLSLPPKERETLVHGAQ